MIMETISERALITGATNGPGTALAEEFAAAGHPLVITSPLRLELEALAERLQDLYGVEVVALAADFQLPTAPKALFDELARRKLPVHTLVNNVDGWFHDETDSGLGAESTLGTIRLNIEAAVKITKLFLPSMLARGSGRVFNVLSETILDRDRLLVVNEASKSFLLWYTDTLAAEVLGRNISVKAILSSSAPPFCLYRDRPNCGGMIPAGRIQTPMANVKAPGVYTVGRAHQKPSGRTQRQSRRTRSGTKWDLGNN